MEATKPIEVKRAIAIQHILTHMMSVDASPPTHTTTLARASVETNEADMSLVDNCRLPTHKIQKFMPGTGNSTAMKELLRNIPAPNTSPVAPHNAIVEDIPAVVNISPPKAPQEHKRKNYSASDVVKIWKSVFGNNMEGVCKLCNTSALSLETRSGVNGWEISHLTSHCDGGSNDLDNVRPLCRSCNRSMGKKEFKAFVFQEYPERYDEILALFGIE